MVPRRVAVDFNEMVTPDEVLLSKNDTVTDEAGNLIFLFEGAAVGVYTDDPADDGSPDRLIADGTACLNHHAGWASAVRWVLKIDHRGVRRASDEAGTNDA
jgi:hypothetical protein